MFESVEAIRAIAEDAATPMTTLAIQWVLANPVITSPIVGASRPEQLAASVAAVDTPLDPAIKAKLDELTAVYRQGDHDR
jgi:aryl-alcohol dehydrogenase-like predicted oxidoreductase